MPTVRKNFKEEEADAALIWGSRRGKRMRETVEVEAVGFWIVEAEAEAVNFQNQKAEAVDF